MFREQFRCVMVERNLDAPPSASVIGRGVARGCARRLRHSDVSPFHDEAGRGAWHQLLAHRVGEASVDSHNQSTNAGGQYARNNHFPNHPKGIR